MLKTMLKPLKSGKISMETFCRATGYPYDRKNKHEWHSIRLHRTALAS